MDARQRLMLTLIAEIISKAEQTNKTFSIKFSRFPYLQKMRKKHAQVSYQNLFSKFIFKEILDRSIELFPMIFFSQILYIFGPKWRKMNNCKKNSARKRPDTSVLVQFCSLGFWVTHFKTWKIIVNTAKTEAIFFTLDM